MRPQSALGRRVWVFVRDLFGDPERLRADLERMIEMERVASRGDPDREARAWHTKLAEADRKRDGYLDLAAEGIMSREGLREKLSALEEVRSTAERKLEELERDTDALLESYAQMSPAALNNLTPEERHRIYRMIGLAATITMDGTLEVKGACEEGDSCCGMEMRYSTP